MRVEIWSDVVCPWCYVGKRRFESALSRFEHRAEVDVVWRSFELDPSAPRLREGPYGVRLAEKYGVSVEQAGAMIDRMVQAGHGDGLSLRFDIARPGSTLDAHRLLHLARSAGVQDELKERLLAAAFTNGEAIAGRETLARCAADVGLDVDETQRVLATDTYTDDVRSDEQEAARLGVNSVPFFAFDRRYGISGAQPSDVLLDALRRAWTDSRADSPTAEAGPAAGTEPQSCKDDTCAV